MMIQPRRFQQPRLALVAALVLFVAPMATAGLCRNGRRLGRALVN